MTFFSEHFTFEELTRTSEADLQAASRREAWLRVWWLRRVARELLEPIRSGLGRRIHVTSGYRSSLVNTRIKGSANSQHCKGQAADLVVEGLEDRIGQLQVLKWIRDKSGIKFGQLLLERGCIHISLPRGNNDGEIAEWFLATGQKRALSLAGVDALKDLPGQSAQA